MITEDLMKLADAYATLTADPAAITKARQALLDALEAQGQEVARLREVNAEQYGALDLAARECTTLRAELAAIRAQEPVAIVDKRIPGNVRWGEWSSLQDGDKLYSAPVASPDVGALVEVDAIEAIDQVMEQAQVFASAWSLVGGVFDQGNAMEDADEAKAELRIMVASLARAALTQSQAARVPDASPAAKDAGLVADGWFVWDGGYEKQSYDVWVKGCDVVLGCWPNAGKMSATDGSGRQWSPSDVLAVRVSGFQGRFPKPPASPKIGGI